MTQALEVMKTLINQLKAPHMNNARKNKTVNKLIFVSLGDLFQEIST